MPTRPFLRLPVMRYLPLLLLLLATPLAAQSSDTAAPIPAWALEDMARMVGSWKTDNSAYQSDTEPFDAYGMEWTWILGQKSVTGQLYAFRDGEATAPFWQFRAYWHPGEARMVAFQIGRDGSVGTGTYERTSDDQTRSLQTFYDPTREMVYRVGHRTIFHDDRQVTESFDVDAAGTWTPRRTYTWTRADESASH